MRVLNKQNKYSFECPRGELVVYTEVDFDECLLFNIDAWVDTNETDYTVTKRDIAEAKRYAIRDTKALLPSNILKSCGFIKGKPEVDFVQHALYPKF